MTGLVLAAVSFDGVLDVSLGLRDRHRLAAARVTDVGERSARAPEMPLRFATAHG